MLAHDTSDLAFDQPLPFDLAASVAATASRAPILTGSVADWEILPLWLSLTRDLLHVVLLATSSLPSLILGRGRGGCPLDPFIEQVSAILASVDNAKGDWLGTSLPARAAAVVQRLADANFPLMPDQAQDLLRILDVLIDLGDRRSAGLEQTEAFKGIQAKSFSGKEPATTPLSS